MPDLHAGPGAPSCLLAQIDRRLALSAVAIGLIRGEPAQVLTTAAPSLRTRIATLLGRSRPNGLADPRLEVLRAVAAGLRDRRRPLDPALRSAALSSGLSEAGLAWIEQLARRGFSTCGAPRPWRTNHLRRVHFRDRQ